MHLLRHLAQLDQWNSDLTRDQNRTDQYQRGCQYGDEQKQAAELGGGLGQGDSSVGQLCQHLQGTLLGLGNNHSPAETRKARKLRSTVIKLAAAGASIAGNFIECRIFLVGHCDKASAGGACARSYGLLRRQIAFT